MITLFPSIGLDLGMRHLKGVQLQRVFHKVYLKKFFHFDLGQHNEKYPNSVDTLEAIKMTCETNNLKEIPFHTNIGQAQLKYLDLKIPIMEKKELIEFIPLQIEKSMKTGFDKISYDYTIEAADNEEELKVKVFYIRSNKIKMIVKMFDDSQNKLKAIDSDDLSLIRMLKFNRYVEAGKTHILVDLGESHTTAILIQDQKLVLSHTLNVSCGYLNHNMQHKFKAQGLSYQDIEPYKMKILSESGDEKQLHLNQLYLEILQKIQENIGYFQVFLKGVPVDSLLFTGGGMMNQKVCEIFSEHYKIESTLVNPFRKIEFSKSIGEKEMEQLSKISGLMSTAVGLALRDICS